MKQYIWLITGIILISVFYFCLTLLTEDYWFHAEATVIFAGLVILIFLLYITREPFPIKVRNILIIAYFIIFCLSSISWVQSKRLVFQQKEYLITIRQEIDDGQIRDRIYNYLIPTLYKYHVKDIDSLTIGKVFKQQIECDDCFISDVECFKSDSMGLFISSLTEGKVVMIGEGAVTGIDNAFLNFSGRTGKMQYTGTLSKDGIKYVRNN